MTSNQFETVAKNAVTKVMKEQLNIEVEAKELEMVWFAHELGYKKCTIYSPKMGKHYAEITYNKSLDEIYVDVYLKQVNRKLLSHEFDFVE